MMAVLKPYVTPEEYLARERLADTKSEYYGGEIFAMAGGSRKHSRIAVNVAGELNEQLSDRPCDVYNSDMRVRMGEGGPYAYPDVTVVCGEAEFEDAEEDTLTNPTIIFEVLSPTTEAWDRGGKFEQYQQITSLREYVLIAQGRPRVERYARQTDEQWLLTNVTGLDSTLSLGAIDCELTLADVYRKVRFLEDVGPRQ